jgi:hypothetical protein
LVGNENLPIANSPEIINLGDEVIGLRWNHPAGNFYQVGFTSAMWNKARLSANVYRREFSHYAEDDLLLNTGVSFSIALSRAPIYGVEVKLETPEWGFFSALVPTSNVNCRLQLEFQIQSDGEVSRAGLEPATTALKVQCSTN